MRQALRQFNTRPMHQNLENVLVSMRKPTAQFETLN